MQNWATPLIICFKKRDGKCIKDTDNPSDGTGTSLALAIIIIFARSKHFCPFMPSIYYLYILIITIIIIIIIIKIIIVIIIIIIIIAIKINFARSKHFCPFMPLASRQDCWKSLFQDTFCHKRSTSAMFFYRNLQCISIMSWCPKDCS